MGEQGHIGIPLTDGRVRKVDVVVGLTSLLENEASNGRGMLDRMDMMADGIPLPLMVRLAHSYRSHLRHWVELGQINLSQSQECATIHDCRAMPM